MEEGCSGVAPEDRTMDLSSVDDSNFCICTSPFNSKCFFTRSHSFLQTSGGGRRDIKDAWSPLVSKESGTRNLPSVLGSGFTPLL